MYNLEVKIFVIKNNHDKLILFKNLIANWYNIPVIHAGTQYLILKKIIDVLSTSYNAKATFLVLSICNKSLI